MNKDLVFASSVTTSSLPLPTATIPALDFPVFTTDHQLSWRSPTPSTSAASSQITSQNSFNQDFQLFAAPETPQRISPASRAQATSSTAPNNLSRAQHRHLSLSSRVSPVQSTVSPSLGSLHSSTNHRSYSSPALHYNNLQRQNSRQLAHLQRRPPVPLFNSTADPRRNSSAPNIPQGITHHRRTLQSKPLTSSSGPMSTTFDSMYLPGGDFFTSPDDFLDLDTKFQSSHFTAVNPGANDGTISPSDLFKDDSMIMSAPPSTAFPNLSTPDSSFLESPAMASSGLNTSPLDDGILDAQLNFAELDSMAPLFPQNGLDQFAHMPTESLKSNFSAANSRPASTHTGMERTKSSPGRPPSQPFHHGRKHSETYGVSKASKSRKSLPQITIESDDDKETAKRKKNTAAARKSRQRKQEHAEAAEAEIQRLRGIIYRLGADPDVDN